MKVGDLISAFEAAETLPVDVNDVLKCLREGGHDDDIAFVGVDLDPDILLGKIKTVYVRNGVYGEPQKLTNIYYHRGWGADWQRFISCKELIHLLDPPSAYTKGSEELTELAERIGLPPSMMDPLTDGIATNVDRLAEFRALAILLPPAAREPLVEPYRREALKAEDVARIADIPERYAAMAMHSSWPVLYDLLKRY